MEGRGTYACARSSRPSALRALESSAIVGVGARWVGEIWVTGLKVVMHLMRTSRGCQAIFKAPLRLQHHARPENTCTRALFEPAGSQETWAEQLKRYVINHFIVAVRNSHFHLLSRRMLVARNP